MKCILYMQSSGVMACLTPYEGERRTIILVPEQAEYDDEGSMVRYTPPQTRMETDKEFYDRLREKDVPKDASHVILMEEGSVPKDFRFWECYHTREGAIVLDMPKAREAWRNALRAKRDAPDGPLRKLDVEFQRAQEAGKDTAAVVRRKQALRDITKDPRIEAAKNLAELMEVELPE